MSSLKHWLSREKEYDTRVGKDEGEVESESEIERSERREGEAFVYVK